MKIDLWKMPDVLVGIPRVTATLALRVRGCVACRYIPHVLMWVDCSTIKSRRVRYVSPHSARSGDAHETLPVLRSMAGEDQDLCALPTLRLGYVRLCIVQLCSQESGE